MSRAQGRCRRSEAGSASTNHRWASSRARSPSLKTKVVLSDGRPTSRGSRSGTAYVICVPRSEAPRLRVVSDYATASIDQKDPIAFASASCPNGKQVVGGGGGVDSPSKAWLANLGATGNFGGSDPHPSVFHAVSRGKHPAGVSAYAICNLADFPAPPLPLTILYSFFAPSGDHQLSCGKGTAIGGGTRTNSGYLTRTEPVVPSPGQDPSAWKGRAGADGAAITTICTGPVPGISLVSAYGAGEFKVSCPGIDLATSGGVGVDDPTSEVITRSEPTLDLGRRPTGWKANIQGGSQTGTVYAICISRLEAPRIFVYPTYVNIADGLGDYAECQGDGRLTGAGAGVDDPTQMALTSVLPVPAVSSGPAAFKPDVVEMRTAPRSGTPSGGATIYPICMVD